MILSPAKTLDLTEAYTIPGGKATNPICSQKQTAAIATTMKKEKNLGKLLSISPSLATTAVEYWKDFSIDPSKAKLNKPCCYTFSGAAYQGLQFPEIQKADTVAYLQRCLRIIDPLYGALRPLDAIQPYRLEMATKGLKIQGIKIKLAEYWSAAVTKQLSEDLANNEPAILLNLASDEYSAAVNPKELPKHVQYVKVIFREQGRVVTVYAKRARGLMVRYVGECQASSLDDVKKFDLEGYQYQEDASDETTLVFDRPKQEKEKPPPKKKARKSK